MAPFFSPSLPSGAAALFSIHPWPDISATYFQTAVMLWLTTLSANSFRMVGEGDHISAKSALCVPQLLKAWRYD